MDKMVQSLPDSRGHFGLFGGKFVPETLMTPLEELETVYLEAKYDAEFQSALRDYLQNYAGRPTPLYYAQRLTEDLGGGKIYLKREDLTHTGAHKINNTIAQGLLTKRMGKRRVIAETGAGQHGVATATAAALFGLKCDIYMGEEDMERQALNVFRMRLLSAQVIPVTSGSRTLKDAINETLRDWVATVRHTHYIIGSVVGPSPYPMMIRDFQSVIGQEAREQILAREGKLPDYCLACVGGGSNSIGLFYPFISDTTVKLVGIEAGGLGLKTNKHGATLAKGTIGILHGSLSYLLQDENGQIAPTHSVSAGLDYPGVGPEHSYYKQIGRIEYTNVTDEEALDGFCWLSKLEGIIPALECAHAIAYAKKLVPSLDRDQSVLICLSGRGDKDVQQVEKILGP